MDDAVGDMCSILTGQIGVPNTDRHGSQIRLSAKKPPTAISTRSPVATKGNGLARTTVYPQPSVDGVVKNVPSARRMRDPMSSKFDVPGMLRLSKQMHDKRIIACCVTCEHFDDKLEMCKLAKMRPPAHVIAYGCPSWDDNRIPF